MKRHNLILDFRFKILDCFQIYKSSMTRIGLISDTHGFLDEKVFEHFKNCDEVWHIGDFGPNVHDQLKDFKPLKGVYGNIDEQDIRSVFPEKLVFMCEEVKVMIHHIGIATKIQPGNKRRTGFAQTTTVYQWPFAYFKSDI